MLFKVSAIAIVSGNGSVRTGAALAVGGATAIS
jgi:hypothetical protein